MKLICFTKSADQSGHKYQPLNKQENYKSDT